MVNDGGGSSFYTRAGEFTFDRNGDLRNPDGHLLQGYQVTGVAPSGALILGGITDINIPGNSTSPPMASTIFTVDVNLDAGAAAGQTYSTTVSFHDSLGNSIPVTFDFLNTGTGQWTASASIPPAVGTGVTLNGAPSIPVTFDPSGNLLAPPGNVTVGLTLTNGAASPQNIVWDLYDAAGLNRGDVTGYASPSTTTFQTQDGYPAGTLRSVAVDESGVVTGAYSNGQLTPLFQVALVDFPSLYGLTKMGNNLYAESRDSGQPLPGTPGSGTLGSVSPSAIEMSNVDLAQEFVKMITTQRAFQANSRVITTSDEVLTELINIKR